jgi:hypothetical protein
MAYTLRVFNNSTAARARGRILKTVVSVGLAASAIFGITQWVHGCSMNRIDTKIENAINQGNYALAFSIVDSSSLSGSNKAKYLQQIDNGIKIQPYMTSFDHALATHAIDDAKGIVSSLESTGLADSKLITSLQIKINAKSPDGLRQQILATNDAAQKELLIREYVTAYPTGENVQEFSREASKTLIGYMGAFEKQLANLNGYNETYAALENLDDAFLAYSKANAPLAIKAPLEQLVSEADQFLKQSYLLDKNGKTLSIGDTVKVMDLSGLSTTYNKNYIEQRAQTIPLGSVGEVVGLGGSSYNYYIKFADITQYAWKTDWGLGDYWINGAKNVAFFKAEELQKATIVTATEKAQFEMRMNSLEASLAKLK